MTIRDEKLMTDFRDAFCELLVWTSEIERVRADAPDDDERKTRLADLFQKLRAAAGKFVPLYDACLKRKLANRMH